MARMVVIYGIPNNAEAFASGWGGSPPLCADDSGVQMFIFRQPGNLSAPFCSSRRTGACAGSKDPEIGCWRVQRCRHPERFLS